MTHDLHMKTIYNVRIKKMTEINIWKKVCITKITIIDTKRNTASTKIINSKTRTDIEESITSIINIHH